MDRQREYRDRPCLVRKPKSVRACNRNANTKRPQRTMWLLVLLLHSGVVGETLPNAPQLTQQEKIQGAKDRDLIGDGAEVWSRLVPVLQEALSDASFHSDSRLGSLGNPDQERRDRQQRWRRRWKRFRQACSKTFKSSTGTASVAVDPLLASTAMAAASVERELSNPSIKAPQQHAVADVDGERTFGPVEKNNRKKRQRERRREGAEAELDVETVEGARLISASFGIIANTFGLLADGVRIVGDTAAGMTGSSVKLMGTAVKTVSAGLDTAGRVLEPNKTSADDSSTRRKPLTSERLINQKRGVRTKYGGPDDNLVGNTRHLAARSVRLLGSVVRGVGDTLVLAGAATESVASSTAGVAEDAVRIVENFAGSLSYALMPRRYVQHENRDAEETEEEFDFDRDFPIRDTEQSFVSFGTYAETEQPSTQHALPALAPSLLHRLRSEHQSTIRAVLGLIGEQIWELLSFVVADTEGIPSFATQLLGVMFLCYLTAVLTLSPPREKKNASARSEVRPTWKIGVNRTTKRDTDGDTEKPTSCNGDKPSAEKAVSSCRYGQPHKIKSETKLRKQTVAWDVFKCVKNIVIVPWKLLKHVAKFLFRFIFSRNGALLFVYGVAWLYLCRASQLRSISIHRNGEAMGFRSAVSSIGTTSPSVAESAVWLNALVNQTWRVFYSADGKADKKWSKEQRSYPKFVTRAMENDDVQSSYGGLEPYISSSIGRSLLKILDSSKASRPNDVAYVSLYSLTLGKKPPMVRSMELRGVKHNGRVTQYLVDVDAALDDFSLVVEIKLSSLEYALLPSTKVSINALDVRLPLQVSLSSRPDYPYVSKMRLSLAHAPDCKVRITPLSDDSGLRGVDLGSLPVINDWVQEVIRESLSEYVSPKFVAVNLGELLYSSGRKSSATPSPTRPDITQLRQKTKKTLNTNPRTSSAGIVSSMTSVADHLPSHHSATKAAGQEDPHSLEPARPQYLVKPNSQLAQLAMERWAAKSTKVVESTKQDVEREPMHGGLPGVLAKPLAIVTPFVIAMAAGVFRDRLVEDDSVSE